MLQRLHIHGTTIAMRQLKFLLFILSSTALAIPPANTSTFKLGTLSGVLKASSGTVSGSATTSDLTEGSNLYYTAARFNSAFSGKTTADLTEGSNLYYTTARVQAAAKAGTTAQAFYVAQDVGNDANDCSILKPCRTIQAGVTAANAVAAYYNPAMVYVSPTNSTNGYTENVTLSQQGVNLMCANPVQNSRACYLKGILTVNLTGTSGGAKFIAASNEVYVSGFVISQNSSSATLQFTGTTFQRLALINCYIDQNGTGSTVVVSNSGVNGVKSTLTSYDTAISNGNASNPTVSITDGRFWMFGTQPTIANGNASGHAVDQSGTSSFVCNLCAITGQVNVTDNTANATLNLSTIASGANSCVATPSSPNTGLITIAYFGCTSTATNSITGSGVVFSTPGSLRLSSSGDIVSTVTQAVVNGFPQGQTLIGAGASTVTNSLLTLKNAHFTVQQTTAPTTTLSGNAGTGGSPACTLSNATDHSGKIALTTGTSAWASGTQCTITYNKAFAVAPNCVFSPNNASAASKAVSQQINFTTTTTTLLVSFGAADTAQTTYNWMYSCSEKG